MPEFDLVIRNGSIIDGTRQPRFSADVGIRGDRIAALGDLGRADARSTIDAGGRIVAPGFIDVHNHSDGWLLKTPHLAAKTLQGFTTEVLMADGISYAPVNPLTAREWVFYLRALDGLRMDEYDGWEGIADFMLRIEGQNVQNAAAHVPYANVRSLVCGFGRQHVDDYQMKSIQREIRESMHAGAVGVSTGLDYIVQCFSTTDELAAACSAAAEFGGLYVTHVRYKTGLLPALKEAVEIGRRAGVRVHISHLKPTSTQQSEEVLSYIDQTARHEVEFSFDLYPYQPGSTMLHYLLPYEVWEEGPLAAPRLLAEEWIRARFAQRLDASDASLLDEARIAWVAGKENSRLQGKCLREYIAEQNLPPADALADLLIEERLGVLAVVGEGDDRLVRPFLAHDLCMIGTDGIYTEDGPIHPRMFGSSGRILGRCVRDLRLFSLEDAVYKLAGFAAERFGLEGRGTIREGAFADVVIFDPQSVADLATFEQPRQFTTGVDTVVVNGVPIVSGGTPVENLSKPLPGRFLRHAQ